MATHKEQLAALRKKVKRVKALATIRPHDYYCAVAFHGAPDEACDCWKSEVLKALEV